MDQTAAKRELIYVPSLCLVEVTYLIEKGRLPQTARARLVTALEDAQTPCRLVPLDRLIADAVSSVNRSEVPDLPDRIIAATALVLGVPLVTRDRKIRALQIQTIW